MKKQIEVLLSIIVAAFLLIKPLPIFSQADNYNCTCLACGVPCNAPVTAHRCDVNPNYGKSISNSSPTYNSSNDYKAMIVSSIFNAMLNSSNDDAEKAKLEAAQLEQMRIAAENARQKKIRDSLDLLAYNQLMSMYKTLPDGNADLDFKTLNGDAEQLSGDAQKQFNPNITGDENVIAGRGTNFFGTMTESDINTVIDPDNDPNIVDLHEAQSYIVDNLKTESEIKASEKQHENKTEVNKEVQKPDCMQLQSDIDRLLTDREKFKKNLDLTLAEYDAWKKKKDQALWNAATDGISFAASALLEYVKYTRESALKIRDVLLKNEGKYLIEGVFSPEEIVAYKSMLDARIANFSIASFGQGYSEAWEYYGFVKNLIQSYAENIGKTDDLFVKMMNSPVMQELKSEFPVMDATQFLTTKAIESFFDVGFITKGPFKMSYLGLTQLAIDQAFNLTDWYLSYKNFCTNRDIIGKELESAKYLQGKINEKVGLQNQFCNK